LLKKQFSSKLVKNIQMQGALYELPSTTLYYKDQVVA